MISGLDELMNKIFLIFIVLLNFTLQTYAEIPSSKNVAEERSDGVRLEFKDRSLEEILRTITKTSGIVFQVPEAMARNPISVSIHGKDWPTAIDELLEGFNVMAVWSEDISQSHIKILESGASHGGMDRSVMGSAPDQAHRSLVVNGSSMHPTLKTGDEIQLDANYYQSHSPQKGDLVAIKFQSRNRMMVKRVLAVPGDLVEIASGRLSVNGEKPRTISGKSSGSRVLSLQLKRYGNRVPENNFLVMGDNSGRSFDSADYGIVSYNQLAGKIIP